MRKNREMYACDGCGFSELRPAGTKQWHDCHPAKFPMTPLSIKTVVSRSMRLLRASLRKGGSK